MKDTKRLKAIMAKNIQIQLDKRGISQTIMARDLGIPEMTVSNWMKAKTYPRVDKIQLMADYFNIFRSDLTEEKRSVEWDLSYTEYDYFPDIHISAGEPFSVEAIESAETIIIPDKIMGKYAGHQDIFFAHVNGDSMNKIIPHGSLIAIKPVNIENLKDGDIVVFSCCHEYSVKRFYIDGNRLMFKPESTDHRFGDYIVNSEQEEVRIHGKVITYIVNRD